MQRSFQALIVGVGDFTGAVFEIEVAQVFVDGVFAFAQVTGASFLGSKVEVARQIEDVEERRPARR